jgi:hypothetical protein
MMFSRKISWMAVFLVPLPLLGFGAPDANGQPPNNSDKSYTLADPLADLKNIMDRWATLKRENKSLKTDLQRIKDMEQQSEQLDAKIKDAKDRLDREAVKDVVAGRKASGRLDTRKLYVTFGTDGSLSAYTTRNTTERTFSGEYTISANQIEFELGPSKFTGTIEGNRITGTRSRVDGVTDSWEVTLSGPAPNAEALKKAQAAYNKAVRDYERHMVTLENRKKEYTTKRDKIDSDLELIQAMIGGKGTTPPKGSSNEPPYQISYDDAMPKDKATVAKYPFRVPSSKLPADLWGKEVDDGHCAKFVQKYSDVGPTSGWKKGTSVRDSNDIPPGTPIATFDENGKYPNKPTGNHVAYYMGKNDRGIFVLDQYWNKDNTHKGVKCRFIPYQTDDYTDSPSNDAKAYSVITR